MANTPLEVQMLIMEWVYRLSQSDTVDYATLSACALVCIAWTPTAQRLLFRRISEHAHNDKMKSLIRTLRTTPRLSVAVRSIDLSISFDKSTSEFSDNVALLEVSPQVQGIYIREHMLDEDMYPAFEGRLRALQLQPVFMSSYGSPSFVALLLRTWPNLRTLNADGCYIDALTPISGTGALQALTLPQPDSLDWLLSPNNDFTALRDLELIKPFWDDAAWQQLHSVLPELHTLRVMGFFPPQAYLERLERLESFIFTDLPQEDVVFPPNLRHVGYHAWNTTPMDATDCTVAALGALANLQLVTTTRRATEAQIKALESICRDRGAQLEIRQAPIDFPYPRWDVDWL